MDLKYTNGNEPAFPVKNDCEHFEGLSILDYFAAKAMQALLTGTVHYGSEDDAEKAYRMAGWMLKARAKAQLTTNGNPVAPVPQASPKA